LSSIELHKTSKATNSERPRTNFRVSEKNKPKKKAGKKIFPALYGGEGSRFRPFSYTLLALPW